MRNNPDRGIPASTLRGAHARRVPDRKLGPHDLRHAIVTRKLAAGVPAQLLMRYVGHADLEVIS